MEGPQTRALADRLNEVLTGKPVEQIIVPEHRWQANVLLLNCVGQVIQRIRSHGKWLFFDFSHGVTWLCQLITQARWIIQAGDAPARPARKRKAGPLITLHMRSAAGHPISAILIGRPIFYILPTANVRSHPEIKNLGPDPLSTPSFYDDFPYRLRQNPGRTIASALLDQQTIAGLGNALKCEILFGVRFAPCLRVGALYASQIDMLASMIVSMAATASNFAVNGQTYPYRVYDRSGLPCAVCGADIVADHSGQDGHLTWYCPACQPLGQEPTLFEK